MGSDSRTVSANGSSPSRYYFCPQHDQQQPTPQLKRCQRGIQSSGKQNLSEAITGRAKDYRQGPARTALLQPRRCIWPILVCQVYAKRSHVLYHLANTTLSPKGRTC
ncbi:hypothetical protein BaRGS_00006022 [Batillaria attramentaria]|uniref:Uncharacterized protein n=1 Tax=Batillaria attramentaria TaxID=370345 RepID=A0ABD0LTG8_9CAEN